MSFGYSDDFTAEAAQKRLQQIEPPSNQQPVIDGKLVTRRFEWTIGTFYVVSMLTVIVWGIMHGNLEIAALAASGLASISIVTLFNGAVWRRP